MDRKPLAGLILASYCFFTTAQAQTLRQCTNEERNSDAPFLDASQTQETDSPLPYDENVSAHRRFTLPVLNYTRRTAPAHFPFSLSLLVDDAGKVVCLSSIDSPDDQENAYPQRQTVYMSAVNWHYVPFHVEGTPHAVRVSETIPEQIFLPEHVAMPKGALASSSLRLIGWWGEVTLNGNGKGVYHDRWADAEKNTSHTFTVSPGEVAALIERFRSADLWSAESRYIVRYVDDYTAPEILTLRIGAQSKVVSYHNPDSTGMPQAVLAAINEFKRLVDLRESIHQRPVFDTPPIPVIPAPLIPVPQNR